MKNLTVINKKHNSWIDFQSDDVDLSIEVMIPGASGNEYTAFYLTIEQIEDLKKLVDSTVREIEKGPITTERIDPPIPTNKHDWQAFRDSYDEGDEVGYGKTEQEAINDLIEQENKQI